MAGTPPEAMADAAARLARPASTPACAAARGGARAAARPFVVCRETEGAFAS